MRHKGLMKLDRFLSPDILVPIENNRDYFTGEWSYENNNLINW
jgi:hypothetical protein